MKEIHGTSYYQRLHYWLRENYGKADYCEANDCKGISNYYGWALKRGKKYEFKRNNYIQLCKSCHSKYDLTDEGLEKSKFDVGENHPNSKLTNEQVKEIRKIYSSWSGKKKDLAKRFGISYFNLKCIVNYVTWKHI